MKNKAKKNKSIKDDTANPLLIRQDSVLVVVDVQERLINHIYNHEKITGNLVKLLKFAKIIDLPVIITEQEKLGPTIEEIASEIPHFKPILKIEFSAWKCREFAIKINKLSKKNIILAGIETHICISQTALDMLPCYNISIVSDAVSSRTSENREIALNRLGRSGAIITTTEMAIYELLERAGTREFKETLGLVK